MPLETALQGKPWYWGFGIGLILAGVCIYAAESLWVKQIKEDIKTADAELDELSKKIEAGRTAERKLPQFREEVSRLELELEKLRRILPSTRNTEDIIKKIKALVDQGDFVLKNIAFPKLSESPAGEEPFVDWPISIQVDGTYHGLALLFNRLSNFTRIINVEQFTISALADQQKRTISGDFVAKTFVYVEPKPVEADAAAPKRGAPGGGDGGE